MFNLELPWMPF